jgi:hypothetical protein
MNYNIHCFLIVINHRHDCNYCMIVYLNNLEFNFHLQMIYVNASRNYCPNSRPENAPRNQTSMTHSEIIARLRAPKSNIDGTSPTSSANDIAKSQHENTYSEIIVRGTTPASSVAYLFYTKYVKFHLKLH